MQTTQLIRMEDNGINKLRSLHLPANYILARQGVLIIIAVVAISRNIVNKRISIFTSFLLLHPFHR